MKNTKLFVNLPIKDLNKTVAFFTKLGFTFNPQFTNENATCMIIGENIFAMLLVEEFFKTFIPNKEMRDARKSAEVILALSVGDRAEVDSMIKNATDAGGKEYRSVEDHGWMYTRAFEDLDGHIWEIFYADDTKIPKK